MKRSFVTVMLCALLVSFAPQGAHADVYLDCRTSCNQAFAACMGDDKDVEVKKQSSATRGTCEAALRFCYVGCSQGSSQGGSNASSDTNASTSSPTLPPQAK